MAILGPGLLVAATGVGAGDLAAAFAGSGLGTAVLWAVLVGAFVKFVVTEGLARWQLATGETLLEGAVLHIGRPFRWAVDPGPADGIRRYRDGHRAGGGDPLHRDQHYSHPGPLTRRTGARHRNGVTLTWNALDVDRQTTFTGSVGSNGDLSGVDWFARRVD